MQVCVGYLEWSGDVDVYDGMSGAYLAWGRNETSGNACVGREIDAWVSYFVGVLAI